MTYNNVKNKGRYRVPVRMLCLILSIIMVLPVGSSAAGFVAPVQSLSAGVVRIAHDGMGAAANALSAIGESISGRLGSFGGMFMNGLGWFINLLSIDPPEGLLELYREEASRAAVPGQGR